MSYRCFTDEPVNVHFTGKSGIGHYVCLTDGPGIMHCMCFTGGPVLHVLFYM